MKYETLFNIKLPKIGFGTWSMGGGMSANTALDPKSLAALRSALELGYTHFDTAEVYASGHCEQLVGRAIREARSKREDLFITTKVSPEHLTPDQIRRSCEGSLVRLDMEYIDLYLIHWPRLGMNLKESFQALNELVRAGKVKYLGVSNFNLKLLKLAQAESITPLLTDQVPYSLMDRSYSKNGVLEYCQNNNILLTAYSPLEQGGFKSNKLIDSLAQAHAATPAQIALAWLVAQPRVVTIPMSFNPQHQKENFTAADIVLTSTEITQLSAI